MGSYIPNTGKEQLEMLKSMGYSSMDDLFAAIPDDMKLKDGLDLPEGKSELEVSRIMKGIAAKNRVFSSIFRGAGAYNHYIPAVVGSVLSNESVQTAYTPYQAEISQGLLQSIFESDDDLRSDWYGCIQRFRIRRSRSGRRRHRNVP